MEQLRWYSVEEKPLVNYENNIWTVNEGVPDEFLAALQVFNKINGKTTWWIRHCVIVDQYGLCVVGDDDNEPCGWEIKDVTHWHPLPPPPSESTPIEGITDEQDWRKLAEIAPPEKWLKMYEQYSEMLTKEDVAGWWQEQFVIADKERNELKAKYEP